MTEHVVIRLKFKSLLRHLVLTSISKLEDKSMFSIECRSFIIKSHRLSLYLWLNTWSLKLDMLIHIRVHSKRLPKFASDLIIQTVMHVMMHPVHSFGTVTVVRHCLLNISSTIITFTDDICVIPFSWFLLILVWFLNMSLRIDRIVESTWIHSCYSYCLKHQQMSWKEVTFFPWAIPPPR